MRVGVIGGMSPVVLFASALAASASRTPEEHQRREERREEARRTGPQQCACGVVTAAGPECRKCRRGKR